MREVPGSIPGAALCFCLGGYLGEPCGSHSCTCCLAAPFQCNVKESRTVLLKADSFAGQANHTLLGSLAENVWCPNTEKIVAHASRQQHAASEMPPVPLQAAAHAGYSLFCSFSPTAAFRIEAFPLFELPPLLSKPLEEFALLEIRHQGIDVVQQRWDSIIAGLFSIAQTSANVTHRLQKSRQATDKKTNDVL